MKMKMITGMGAIRPLDNTDAPHPPPPDELDRLTPEESGHTNYRSQVNPISHQLAKRASYYKVVRIIV